MRNFMGGSVLKRTLRYMRSSAGVGVFEVAEGVAFVCDRAAVVVCKGEATLNGDIPFWIGGSVMCRVGESKGEVVK